RKRLVQVIVNLLNNAAKYTPDGGEIKVSAVLAPGEIRLSVVDNGIGIDAALLPEVFELFTQAKRTPDRAQGGLGLGLALVRSMVGLHGGRVEADSAGPGRGSRFDVVLPLLTDSAGVAPVAPAGTLVAPPCVPLRILIVDDNRDAGESLGIVLASSGHAVMVEESSQAALRRVQMHAVDVCLLDIGLPDMDGHQLVRHLRALPLAAQATMIALSGYGQRQDLEASRRAGFALHLVKPVDLPRLLALLATLAPA
ncbi:MAG: response regulator, partial [Oxalobacteraceae bacterium]